MGGVIWTIFKCRHYPPDGGRLPYGSKRTGTNGAASGNGEAPSQVAEDNGRVNGHPVNRILRFADPVVKV